MSETLRQQAAQQKPYVGLLITDAVPHILEAVRQGLNDNFEFFGVDVLRHHGTDYHFLDLEATTELFAWSEEDLSAPDWRNLVVAVLKIPELELALESDDELRRKAECFVLQQMDYCVSLNLSTCILRLNDYEHSENTINTVYSKVLKGVSFNVWIDVPMFGKLTRKKKRSDGYDLYTESDNPWMFWRKILSLTNNHLSLCLALRLPDELQFEGIHLQRWLTEPVKCLIINIKQFKEAKDPFHRAYLSGTQTDLVKRFLECGVQILLESDDSRTGGYEIYHHFIKNIKEKIAKDLKDQSKSSLRKTWGIGYENILLDPLQPLKFDLPKEIYESFEKDPIKYVLYEDAIYKAIQSLKTRRRARKASWSEKMVILIAGAGRGPIVQAALRAANKAKVSGYMELIALDKNETAFKKLQTLQETSWRGRVKVFCDDMRTWDPPMGKMDLIVSELLGSFGDNELSPECLDGAQKYLKSDGIIIPQSYSSYIQPIMSSEVYRHVRNYRGPIEEAYQRTYVVNFQNSVRFAQPERLFTFNHPAQLDDDHTNDRYSCLEFTATKEGVLHGFAGYFDSILFDDVMLSITPADHTRDMISWWPLFIPIRMEIPLKVGDRLVVHFYRKVDVNRVWYEWTVTEPRILAFHNRFGLHHSMGC